MFKFNVTFKCQLADETVYVDCSQLNSFINAESDALVFYTDLNNCQGQCRKSELTFISVETY